MFALRRLCFFYCWIVLNKPGMLSVSFSAQGYMVVVQATPLCPVNNDGQVSQAA